MPPRAPRNTDRFSRHPRTGPSAGTRVQGGAPRPPRRPLPVAPERPPLALPELSAVEGLPAPATFVEAARSIGVEFEEGEVDKLGRYLAMLLAANDVLNLTAITEPQEAWRRHILDSLTMIQILAELPPGARVLDVGSGGGLPGLPLAICMPSLSFTLLEATGKKVLFLRAVAQALGLANVVVVEGRAETVGHDRGEKTGSGRVGGHREKYDVVMARAVGRIHTLAELTIPFVKIGGRAVLIKGQQAADELKEAERALHLLKAVHEGTIDTPTGKIVSLTKQSATPKDYPRRDGEPKRAPLGAAKEEREPVRKPKPPRTPDGRGKARPGPTGGKRAPR